MRSGAGTTPKLLCPGSELMNRLVRHLGIVSFQEEVFSSIFYQQWILSFELQRSRCDQSQPNILNQLPLSYLDVWWICIWKQDYPSLLNWEESVLVQGIHSLFIRLSHLQVWVCEHTHIPIFPYTFSWIQAYKKERRTGPFLTHHFFFCIQGSHGNTGYFTSKVLQKECKWGFMVHNMLESVT